MFWCKNMHMHTYVHMYMELQYSLRMTILVDTYTHIYMYILVDFFCIHVCNHVFTFLIVIVILLLLLYIGHSRNMQNIYECRIMCVDMHCMCVHFLLERIQWEPAQHIHTHCAICVTGYKLYLSCACDNCIKCWCIWLFLTLLGHSACFVLKYTLK